MRWPLALVAMLLAGCTLQGPSPAPDATRDIDLRLESVKAGDGFLLKANATNRGPFTYTHYDMCDTAWHEWLADDGGMAVPIDHDRCLALGEPTALPPGASFHLRRPWNGTMTGHGQAPAGTYTWHVQFSTFEGDVESSLAFRVG